MDTELVGIMICLGLLMPVASMVGAICREKELRQKELMRMMGVTEAEIGWSWFISYVLFYVCIVATIVSIVSFQLYENSNPMALFGFWILTFTALITCKSLQSVYSPCFRV
jgi:ATP-binding cassette subfamily A (ABC1) protein 1